MKCSATINAGVCGFTTNLTADSEDQRMVTLTIETDCDKIAGLAETLNTTPIDAYQEIAKGFDGVVLSAARATLSGCCAGCTVPVGLFKALQAAARVALPRPVAIDLRAAD